MKEKLFVGIDLGTTNTECFIIAGHNEMQELHMADAMDGCILNSIVRRDEKGNYFVGNRLKNADMYKKSWKLLKTHLDKDLTYDYDGKETNDGNTKGIKPSLFSTKILEVIKNEIDYQFSPTQYEIENLIITVPANFRDTARRTVKQAALNAGFDAKGQFKLINEPTSAAVAYGELNKNFADQKVIAYDLGGGTFDVTLLDYIKDDEEGCNFYQAIATDGKNIGGKDFDNRIIDIIYEKFLKEDNNKIYENDISFKNEFYSKLLEEAEGAKKFLSKGNLYFQEKDLIIQGNTIHLNISVSREEFEIAIEPLINETIELTKSAISGYEDSIDSIILIGGSTRVPLVKQKLMKEFEYKILDNADADLIVAQGACYHASSIGINVDKKGAAVLNEILSNGIFSNVIGNVLSLDIAPGTAIPCHVERSYFGVHVDQDSIRSVICNGRGVLMEDDTVDILGDLEIKGLKKEGKKPEINCIYDITEDELVTVTIVSKADPKNRVSTKFSINANHTEIKNEYIERQKNSLERFKNAFPSFNYEKQYERISKILKNSSGSSARELLQRLDSSMKDDEKFKNLLIRISASFDSEFENNYYTKI